MCGKNFQKRIDSLQGTVVSALHKFQKHEEIRMFTTGRSTIRKNGPKIVTAKMVLPNGKELSLDFKPDVDFDFDSVSKRIKDFLNLEK